MITPDPQYLPGQTPITDPLQLQFMTRGQMGYMPQAQFMTPSELGAFRTMPVPDINGYVPQNDGFISRFLTANRGGLGPLPEYTFNTYNPAVSPTLQQVYAERGVHDTLMGIPAMFATGLVGAALPAMFGLPGMAASLFMPDMVSPVTDRIVEARRLQAMTTAKIFGGRDADQALGQGFSYRAARDLDRMIRYSAADDTILKEGDYRDLLQLGIQYGQFDYAQNVDQYKRILKNMRSSITTMMEVFGSTDFKDIMSNMKRMQDMGATAQQYTNIARSEQVYSRMTGLSHQQMVDTYGQPGALTFQQAGLNAMQGSLQSMANAANITYLQRTGVLNPVTLARFGGVSGMAQRMTQQDAKAHNSIIDLILPGMLNQDMTGFRTDIDIPKLLQDPYSLQNLMHQGGRIYSGEQMMNYQANRHELYTKLLEEQGADNVEMMIAGAAGRMSGFNGVHAFRAGLRMIGFGAEEADFKIRSYFSEGAQSARERTMEEARRKRREEFLQKNNIFNQLGRWFRGVKTDVGEGLYRVSESLFGDEEVKTANAAERALQKEQGQSAGDIMAARSRLAASGNTVATPTHYGDSPDEILNLFRQTTGYTDEQADKLFRHLSHGIISETGTTDLNEAMKSASAVGYGALQLIPDHFDDFFKGAGAKYASTFNQYVKDGDQQLLVSLRKKREDKEYRETHGGPTQAELDAEKRSQAGWNAISGMAGFRGSYMSFLMPHVMKDRLGALAKTDDKVAALMESPFLLTTVFPMGNHFGTDTFKKVMRHGLRDFTAESIRADLKETGGLNVALSLYGAADTEFKNLYGQDQTRYEVGRRDFAHLDAERRWFFSGQGGDTGFRGIADRMSVDPDFAVYSQRTSSKNTRGRDVRPDCSGFMREYINELVSERGGFVMNSEKARNAILGKEILTSDKLMETVGQLGTGLKKFNLSNNEAIKKFKQNVREGMLIGLDSDGKSDKDHPNGIDHTGAVVWRNNDWYILEQVEGGRKYTKLTSWFNNYKGRNFYIADLNGIMRPKKGASPYAQQESMEKLLKIDAESKTRSQKQQQDFLDSTLSVNTDIFEGVDVPIQGFNTDAIQRTTMAHVLALEDINRRAQDIENYNPTDFLGMSLKSRFGEAKGELDNRLIEEAIDLSGIANDRVVTSAYELLGETQNDRAGRAYNEMAARIIAAYTGKDIDEARKLTPELRKDPVFQKAMTVTLLRSRKDRLPTAISDIIRNAHDAVKVKNDVRLKEREKIEEAGYNRIFGVDNQSILTRLLGTEEGDVGDIFRGAIFSGSNEEVKGTEFTQGAYFHKLPAIVQLMADYNRVLSMGKGNSDYDEPTKQLRGFLLQWARSAGFTPEEIDAEMSKTNDVGAVIKNLYAKKGIKIEEGSARDKLLSLSVRVAQNNVNTRKGAGSFYQAIEKYKTMGFGQLRDDTLTQIYTDSYYEDIQRALSHGTQNVEEMANLMIPTKVSEERFADIIAGLRSGGENKLADYLEQQREQVRQGKKTSLDSVKMYDLITNKKIYGEESTLETGRFNEQQRARQDALNTGSPTPAAGVAPGSGGRGGLLSEATDRALGQLPSVLDRLNKTLQAMNPKWTEQKRNDASLGDSYEKI